MKLNFNIYSLRAAIILDAAFTFEEYRRNLFESAWKIILPNDLWYGINRYTSFAEEKDYEMFQFVVFEPDGSIAIQVSKPEYDNEKIATFVLQNFLDILNGRGAFFEKYSRETGIMNDFLHSIKDQCNFWSKDVMKSFTDSFGLEAIKKSEITLLQKLLLGEVNFKTKKLIGKPLDPFYSEIFESINNKLYEMSKFGRSHLFSKMSKMQLADARMNIQNLIDARNLILRDRCLPENYLNGRLKI